MPEHPLVPIVRFYLVCAMALAVTWLWPAWGLILLGTNCFGWWGGCTGGCCGNVCTLCTGAVGNQVQVVLGGVTNGSFPCSNCTNKNATWTMTFTNAGGNAGGCNGGVGSSGGTPCNCIWCYGDTSTANNCSSCNAGFGLFLWSTASGTDAVWQLNIQEHAGTGYTNPSNFTNTYSSGTSKSASADLCTKWSATSFTHAAGIDSCCKYSTATVTVTEL